jgi:hypothetical protein
VEADFKALVVECWEEAVDSVSAPVPCMGVEESEVDEPLGDPFVSREELLALEASKVRELFLVRVAPCFVRYPSRVEWTPSVRFFPRGIGLRTNRVHKLFRVPGQRLHDTFHSRLGVDTRLEN